MSTRATYRISATSYSGVEKQYFYIHYDGYPKGAAHYFKAFLSNLDGLIKDGGYRKGKAVVAFGMLPFAEFTGDHDSHGDTEYRYNIYYDQQKGTFFINSFKGKCGEDSQDIWCEFFKGPLVEFINKYNGPEGEE